MTNKRIKLLKALNNFYKIAEEAGQDKENRKKTTRDYKLLLNLIKDLAKKEVCSHKNYIYGEATLCNDCKELIDFQESL